MQVKKKGQTCAEGLKINPFAQVCPLINIKIKLFQSISESSYKIYDFQHRQFFE